jgi:UDP-N-acetylmuramyl pentapeptide phosphotransferase/UDP-N-acetylglucosamine-1-phosphate transferase
VNLRRFSVVALLLGVLLAAVHFQRAQFHPYVVFNAGDALQLVFLNHARGSEAECRAVTARIIRAVRTQCPGCRPLQNLCLDALDTRQRKILSGQPLDIPVMRTAEGAVAFLSTAPDIAHSVCREAERQARGGPSVACATAGPDGIALSLAKVGGASSVDALPRLIHLLWIVLLALVVSMAGCCLIVSSEKLHGRYSHDLTATGPQKFHAVATPRIGGAAMVAALVACVLAIESYGWIHPVASYGLTMLALSAIPAFAGGFGEDVTGKVGVLARLMLTFAAGVFAALLVGATLDRLDMPLLDPLLQQWPLFAIAFTAFAVGGVANAINITDGYNGLAGGYSVMVLTAIGWVAYQVGDPVVLAGSLVMLGAVIGFLVWNYPAGRLFMGDGGAYLLGFWLAELSVLLVVRNPDVSPWFPLVLLAYPVVDTLFSMYRRKLLRGRSAGRADAMHLHQLIYRRLARVHLFSRLPWHKRGRNNLVAIYVCAGAALFIIPALFVWHSTAWLVGLGIAFWVAYLWLYFRLVRLRAPSWLVLSPRRATITEATDTHR